MNVIRIVLVLVVSRRPEVGTGPVAGGLSARIRERSIQSDSRQIFCAVRYRPNSRSSSQSSGGSAGIGIGPTTLSTASPSKPGWFSVTGHSTLSVVVTSHVDEVAEPAAVPVRDPLAGIPGARGLVHARIGDGEVQQISDAA